MDCHIIIDPESVIVHCNGVLMIHQYVINVLKQFYKRVNKILQDLLFSRIDENLTDYLKSSIKLACNELSMVYASTSASNDLVPYDEKYIHPSSDMLDDDDVLLLSTDAVEIDSDDNYSRRRR